MKFTETLKSSLETYFYSTDIPVTVINEIGNEIFSLGNIEGFCKYFKECMDDKCPCSQTHLYASRQAETIGEAYIFSCPAGLTNITVPLIENALFNGAVIAGPFLMDYPDLIIVDEIIQKYHLNINMRGNIYGYLKRMLIIEPNKVTPLSKLLFIVVTSLMEDEKHILKEKNLMHIQQVEIGESIQDLKNTPKNAFYSYECEKQLLLKVKNGDIAGAKTVLNDLIGQIFFSSGGNIDIIKSRTLELCTLLSRASVDGGADFDKVTGLNSSFINKLNRIHNLEELSYWLVKVLDKFTENVFQNSELKNYSTIQKSIIYINENYKNNITLDTVANVAHLNASYFSTLFKKEMGLSFSNYLNNVRINYSKYLLKNTDYSIGAVAFEVGFDDQSYFTKMFKLDTNMTPKEYKKKLL